MAESRRTRAGATNPEAREDPPSESEHVTGYLDPRGGAVVTAPWPAHDPKRCATCSGERRADRYLAPLRRVVAEIEKLVVAFNEAHEEPR